MNTLDNATLDWIEMTNGDVFRGVLDYSNNKFIHFYNFDDKNVTPDLVIVAIIWRLNNPSTRFSVYCALNFPKIELPKINIINKKGITVTSSVSPEVVIPQKIKFSAES